MKGKVDYINTLGEKREEIIALLQQYYKLMDLDEGSYLLEMFNLLYSNKKKLTYEEVAAKCYCDEKSLYRYRLKFNKLAEKLNKEI